MTALLRGMTEQPAASIVLPGLLVIVGLLGVIIPVIPGLIVALIGVLIWALDLSTTAGWVVFGACIAIYGCGLVAQFLIPGKRMKAAGISNLTLFLGVAVGIIGFFVVPVIGGPLGFVLAIFLLELSKSQDKDAAWRSTKAALRGVLHSIGIELSAGLLILTTWVIGVLVTR